MDDTHTSQQETDLQNVPVGEIEVQEDHNPRTTIDERQLEELTASIRQRGILQPLLLRRGPDSNRVLVAGHRRLAAARAAGLASVPALIRDSDQALEDALSENIVRQDLDPIEEARALKRTLGKHSQKALAAKLGKSPGYIRERLRLLSLPEEVQQAVAAGELPLSAAPRLVAIAKVSEPVAEACAALVKAGHAEPHDLEHNPARVVGMIERVKWEGEGEAPVALATYTRRSPDQLPLGEQAEEITRRFDALGGDQHHPVAGYRMGFSMHEEVDAARAYGCLLEFKAEDGLSTQSFICDAGFVADRCLAQLERMEQSARDQDRHQTTVGDQGATGNGDAGEGIDWKEARRQERERERDEAIAVRGANLELGRQLAERFHKPKLTKDLARLVALLAIDGDAESFAARGLRYVDPKLQDVEVRELKSGERKHKTTYADRERCGDYLIDRLGRARSAEEVLGVLVQTLIAAHFADEQATVKSHRITFSLPGSYGYHHDGQPASTQARQEIPVLIEKVARPALPARMRSQLVEQHTAQGQEGEQEH